MKSTGQHRLVILVTKAQHLRSSALSTATVLKPYWYWDTSETALVRKSSCVCTMLVATKEQIVLIMAKVHDSLTMPWHLLWLLSLANLTSH